MRVAAYGAIAACGVVVACSGGSGSGSADGAAGTSSGGSAGSSATGGSAGAGAAGGTGGAAAGAGGTAGGTSGTNPFEGIPYGHVIPADVGQWIGVGVVAPEPTETYSGSTDIDAPTTIENVIIDGCLRITASDVTLRNVIINCDGIYPVRADDAQNLTVEYSQINCGSFSKVFLINDYQNVTVSKSETTGCEDIFFVGGDVDGMAVRYNYFHDLNLTPDSHSDGFQIGEASLTTGAMEIRGNYFNANTPGGKTDIIFATNEAATDILLEDNYFTVWGLRTLRCHNDSQCTVRNNVYEQAFEVLQPGSVGKLLFILSDSSRDAVFECNRYEDGTFLPEMQENVDRVAGATHVTDDCPEYSPR